MQFVKINCAGEIYISGDGVGRGYINNQELTKQRFFLDPFSKNKRMYKSGDLGKWNSNGFVEYIGRVDNQIKIKGYRIELEEIEGMLLQHPLIYQAVVSVAGTDSNRHLIAFYNAMSTVLEHELEQFLQEKLPKYMVPSKFIYHSDFGLTANGKIDRKAVLEQYSKEAEKGDVEDPSRRDIAKYDRVLSVIERNTNHRKSEKISLDSSLGGAGIDSIAFLKVIVDLETEFNFEFDTTKLMYSAFKNVGEIVEYVISKI